MSDELRPQMFTVREVARALRVSESTVRRIVASGELEAVKIRNVVRVPKTRLERWLATRRYGVVRQEERRRLVRRWDGVRQR